MQKKKQQKTAVQTAIISHHNPRISKRKQPNHADATTKESRSCQTTRFNKSRSKTRTQA